jgi:hypothetical protein
MRVGSREQNPKFFTAAWESEREAIAHYEVNLSRGVDDALNPPAP